MKKQASFVALGLVITVSLANAATIRAADDGKNYKVFIYAGQSNAQGKAPIANMDGQAEWPETKELYRPFRKDGQWVVRDDV